MCELSTDVLSRATAAGLVLLAGAKEVHFRVASPPVTGACFYGMDFPTKEELFINQHKGNIESMAKWLGVKRSFPPHTHTHTSPLPPTLPKHTHTHTHLPMRLPWRGGC